ncbi:serine protease [Paracidovorax avenae]|uniref:S1 family peptidase n=1 Tax=Paracidovorax avenae TaxID=80867 RepID=UPI000D15373B|nr:serine protease [Paracidovorax avenae]AVS91255.1 serine protease [Paracidovorax avenae]AVT20116.1 serine protease [Paracidovorax avenae]
MKNLQEATERICELKGSLIALDALLPSIVEALPSDTLDTLVRSFEARAEAARTVILNTPISDHVLAAFERDITRTHAMLASAAPPPASIPQREAVEAILLATTYIRTYSGTRLLTGASGFFFRRDGLLFLVTNRHVFSDEPSSHFPDRIEIGLHTDARNLTLHATFSIPLYGHGIALWRQATDTGGPVDIAAIEIHTDRLPGNAVLQAFDPSHLDPTGEEVAMGDNLAIVGFPLGFHDTVHHLAVARGASIASAYGVRFQQQGCFLTDARTHSGSSGAPVLRRRSGGRADGASLANWQLLGVHSTRMDMLTRDLARDESLGLNCAWYADILMLLTRPA